MASSYPGAIDSLTNPTVDDDLDSVTVPHADQHANANDAIEAIQTELGTDPAGSFADVAARLDDVDTTLGSALTSPLSAALNANSQDIYSIDQLAVGGAVDANASVVFKRTATVSATGYASLKMAESVTWSTGGFVAGQILDIRGTYTVNSFILGFNFLNFQPTVTGSATGYGVKGLQIAPSIGTGTALSNFTGVYISGGATDTVETIGLDLGSTGALAGTTKWAMKAGDYQSSHVGRFTLGAATAPTYALDIKGTAQDRGVIALAESSATPTNPSSSNQALLYVKADKLIAAFNDAGTVRYKYLDLTGTGVTWVHTTTAP